MGSNTATIDKVRASRAGHTFHERWAARRALQLVFPKDDLFAIAVEGLSTSESAELGDEAADVADLILYFGTGDKFQTCRVQQTLQFKYMAQSEPVTASYLKKTLQKFAASLLGFEKEFDRKSVEEKLSFSFVTNTDFTEQLWEAIRCFGSGSSPNKPAAKTQYNNIRKWCEEASVDADRLMPLIEFQASTKSLRSQIQCLRRTLADWTPGVDSQARMRLHGLEELVREKAGLSGQRNNLVKREDVLDSLGCDEDDLFPASTEFVNVGVVTERSALRDARDAIDKATAPILIHAGGGVGKTIFVQSLAARLEEDHETVVFDCFGGGSYRAEDQARHLPKIGLLQIVNELASRGLCDPLLPSDGDRYTQVKAARKRLEQAVGAIRAQSAKRGVLVIIDAADNAQLEADSRNEDAFPKLLLSSLSRNPVDGVKLVLTARPERMDSVIGTSDVERFELGPFSEKEARHFLSSRRESLSELEFKTAFARSGGNARVLDYLIGSWDENVADTTSSDEIKVEELIRKRCEKISKDLHQAGWDDDETTRFFVAISLLPPPIPLNEMADALGWSHSKVKSAVADLAPMLELLKHGAIFRDEPTETFIRETYENERLAQTEIADRLLARQKDSAYAAEALPTFLVVIDDVDRAYALAGCEDYPSSVQTAFGHRRLKLARLHAAFRLAVKAHENDRILQLTMQLAQVAAANAKGDEFIRRSPGLSVCLGDKDTSRRLFQDRSGWRGARDSRLTTAFAFQKELDEACIHQNRAIGWINWNFRNSKEHDNWHRDGPSHHDFASLIFLSVLESHHVAADGNLAKWNFPFSLSVSRNVIALAEQHDAMFGSRILAELTAFASSNDCHSFAMQVALLASKRSLTVKNIRLLSRTANAAATRIDRDAFEDRGEYENPQQDFVCSAALSALIHGSRQSASRIARTVKQDRISSYDYSERHGLFRGWPKILHACVDAWSSGKELQFYHLLPREVRITRAAKSIIERSALSDFLGSLTKLRKNTRERSKKKSEREALFSDNKCREIVSGVLLLTSLAEPLQRPILQRRALEERDFHAFLELWTSTLRFDVHWNAENGRDVLGRRVGLELANIFLKHATSVAAVDAATLVDILDKGRFSIDDKLTVLELMARHGNLKEITGSFAHTISSDIRSDEYIDQRSQYYSRLSESLLSLSFAEAQAYFREGLSQLDQMGGDDYDIVYSILRYAASQSGGWLHLPLGHRLMNLCQTICCDASDKFGWTLFSEAASQSIGYQALYKLLRWSDQDVADYSYGLPQLACFLAKKGYLDARRAAFVLLVCENQQWREWGIGDGLRDILASADPTQRTRIFRAVTSNLKVENPFAGSELFWKSLVEIAQDYPGLVAEEELATLRLYKTNATEKRERQNRRYDSSHPDHSFRQVQSEKADDDDPQKVFQGIIDSCDLAHPHTVDAAIRAVREDSRFICNAGKEVLKSLRECCAYERRDEFNQVVSELIEIEFDDASEAIRESVTYWERTSRYTDDDRKGYVRRLFEARGSELFDLRYTGTLREIRRLSEFCGDGNFISELVLGTLARERVELAGDEWLQVATSLCPYASDEASLAALESLLSGPAASFADEIGEGPFKDGFSPAEPECSLVAEIAWHLLGQGNTFVRWKTARAIKDLADLGLYDDIATLLDLFGSGRIDALHSEVTASSFLNSEQWLLIGIARASHFHGASLGFLRERLEALAKRKDVHIINQMNILKCLKHISEPDQTLAVIDELEERLFTPEKGYVERDDWVVPSDPKSGLRLDYDFKDRMISPLARVFGASEGEVIDLIAAEVWARWPDVEDMNYFGGRASYRHIGSDTFESFRDSIQKHALLSAATTLFKTRPVVRSSYDDPEFCPWRDWLSEFDLTFDDGRWLADRKDAVPDVAKATFILRSDGADMLEADEILLERIGLLRGDNPTRFPLCGSWSSRDGVNVHFVSALAPRRGVIGRARILSRQPFHDLWLPRFDSQGEIDQHTRSSEFSPFISVPECYEIGIDAGDEFAAESVVRRARLGNDLNRRLGLKPDSEYRTWFNENGTPALKSDAWGEWRQEPRDYRSWFHDDGSVLWAYTDWLDSALIDLNKALVFYADFRRSKSYRDFEDTSELHSVVVGLRKADGTVRFWKAKKASKKLSTMV